MKKRKIRKEKKKEGRKIRKQKKKEGRKKGEKTGIKSNFLTKIMCTGLFFLQIKGKLSAF